jgi:hypothetical protein
MRNEYEEKAARYAGQAEAIHTDIMNGEPFIDGKDPRDDLDLLLRIAQVYATLAAIP